ncbi:MAG: hypothetical protein U0231_15025 [Nitrospiraceae bacterium]
MTQVIEPVLSRGAIVLCDRASDSTLAQQGSARGLDLASLERMNGLATDELELTSTLPSTCRPRPASRAVVGLPRRTGSTAKRFVFTKS